MKPATPPPVREFIGCMWHGCRREATCLPRIYCPCSSLGPNPHAEDVSALMGLPLCDICRVKITAKDLLAGERGAEVRKQIAELFRRRNAWPNFDRAVVGRVSRHDTDWKVYLQMRQRVRPN